MTRDPWRTYPATVPKGAVEFCDGCGSKLYSGTTAYYRVQDGAVFCTLACAALHRHPLDTSTVEKQP